MIQGFKEFISKGNALDLAVAVIIGAAFTPIVTAITDVIMDIIDSVLQFTINGSDPIRPGTIITAVVNFLLVAIAVYFAIVAPMNKIKAATAKKEEAVEEAPAAPSTEEQLLTEIRDLLANKN